MNQGIFIETISPIAKADMEVSGILASITIAQACLESGYGTSELAINANNFFGMKCSLSGNTWDTVWDGVSRYAKVTQEQKDGEPYYIMGDFRKYPDMASSIRDHSLYLTQSKDGDKLRYEGLAGERDYRKAAGIIKKRGYASDDRYVEKVCGIIEQWGLTKYDNGGPMRICLDAGHFGKYNQSPCNKLYYESEVVWKLHLMQKKYLEEYGVEVVTTRGDMDTDRGLYERGAASAGCGLFISNHTNAVGSGINNSVDYPAAYCAINGSADGIGMALAQCVETVMGTSQKARIEHRSGKNGDYYGVLRGATAVGTPALILEHSFHTNEKSTGWLMGDDNLDRLARAEADAIAAHYGLSKKTKSGWVHEDGGERFYLGDGRYVADAWYEYNGDWYWFDGSGHMVTNVWYKYNGSWYYLGEDGAMVKGIERISGKWYYMDQDGRMATDPVVLTPDKDGALQYPGMAE